MQLATLLLKKEEAPFCGSLEGLVEDRNNHSGSVARLRSAVVADAEETMVVEADDLARGKQSTCHSHYSALSSFSRLGTCRKIQTQSGDLSPLCSFLSN